MNELSARFLKDASIFIAVIGMLTGIDLLLGAKIIPFLNRMLTTAEVFSIDKAIVDKKVRIFLGFLILVISLLMVLLLKQVVI